jgi:hypothetical protein
MNVDAKYRIDTSLQTCEGNELAHARGAISQSKSFLRVLWLGRQRGQPVDPSVRGQHAYEPQKIGEEMGQSRVTAAIALLGVMATLATLLQVADAEILPLDNGSGKLVRYLCGLGFQKAEEAQVLLRLRMPCKAAVQRCLPSDWYADITSKVGKLSDRF